MTKIEQEEKPKEGHVRAKIRLADIETPAELYLTVEEPLTPIFGSTTEPVAHVDAPGTVTLELRACLYGDTAKRVIRAIAEDDVSFEGIIDSEKVKRILEWYKDAEYLRAPRGGSHQYGSMDPEDEALRNRLQDRLLD